MAAEGERRPHDPTRFPDITSARLPSQRLVASGLAVHGSGGLLDALTDPVILTTHDGRIKRLNPAVVRLFGDPSDLYGRDIEEALPFIAPPQGTQFPSSVWHDQITDASGRTVDVEVRRITVSPFELYLIRDITPLMELNRSREQLLYAVAHEIRASLAVLDGALEMLSDDAWVKSPGPKKLVGAATRASRRLRFLTDNLLSAGSIQSGRFAVTLQPTRALAIIKYAVGAVRTTVAGRHQRIRHHVSVGSLQVLADLPSASQALANLLFNASKYSPTGETILLCAEPDGVHVRFLVEDDGVGIPLEDQAGLFERFYRTKTSVDAPGVGLGLAIVKGIVDAHGGTVGVKSAPGAGTTVWFTLPLAGGS